MTAPHVLISSTYYWPEATGNAPYVTGLAEHLAGNGYRVTVLTGFPHYPEWRSSSRGRAAASECRNNVAIERRWHYVPSSATASKRALYETSIASTGWTAFRPKLKPDVVLAVVPTLAAGLLGTLASRAYRAPFGLVFQDLMGPAAKQNGVKAAGWMSNSLSRMEVAIARRADQVGIITDGFRAYLEGRGVDSKKVWPLRNWSHAGEAVEIDRAATRLRLGWREGDFICLHSGNMGQKQGLENLIDAAACLQARGEPRIRIVLAGDGNDRANLERRTRNLGLKNVSFVGFQPEHEYAAMLSAADLLVVHQRASLTNSALPSKLTSYFRAGGPVLAVAAPDSQTALEVERSRAGIIVPPGDPEGLASHVMALSANPERLRCLGANARTYAATHLGSESALAEYERLIGRLLEKKR